MAPANENANKRLYHRTELPMALGCTSCPEEPVCGGLKTNEVIFSCEDLCRCSDESRLSCPYVCPSKPQEYCRRKREVNGFGFESIGAAPAARCSDLPPVVPWIDSRSCLEGGLKIPVVAVPLSRLFSRQTGKIIPGDRAKLASRFAVTPATEFLITGVSFEQPIEDYWKLARSSGFLDDLAALRPALVTTPNFSLFSDVPREDNLYNMKRIAICWHELASRNIPTSLHLNGRTDRDWSRWREFLTAHPEIGSVAFEFGTGAANLERSRWYVRQLSTLARSVNRELQLVVRGGRHVLPALRDHFRQVVFITPDPLMRARKRRVYVNHHGRPAWRRFPYVKGEKVDHYFLQSLQEYNRMVGRSVALPDRWWSTQSPPIMHER